jgi:hypothetical protein
VPTFPITDVRGGINNTDSPTLLPPNQVVDARNVDFRDGALGAKRRGTAGISISGSAFNSPIVAIFRHTPTNSLANDELWAIDENGNIDRRVGGTWAGTIDRANNHVVVNAANYDANAVSLHGKLFIAAKGTQDRLLVWTGSVLRWAGIQRPPDPTVADIGSGTFSGTRYYRIRYIEQVGGVTVRRSEPTNAISLAPSGSGSGALITKPSGTEATTSVYSEGQTHWEVEASIDNALFYRIATVSIGTSTYTDTTSFTTGYAASPVSEQVGEYVPPHSARHVAVDEDRLVIAGSYFTAADDAAVWWTPVEDDDGVGNDERIPATTKQFLNFDGLDGGRIQALVAGVAGNVYVFKRSRVYKMVRTGILTAAYDPVAESFGRGSTLRGATAGVDQNGVPCVYFLDPAVGLCRIGQRGIEDLSHSIRETWRGRNPEPAIGPRIVYYPDLDQVWYTSPLLNPSEIQTSQGSVILTASGSSIVTSQTSPGLLVIYEVRYGGSMFHDGMPGAAQALTLFPRDNGVVPVIGTELVPIGGGNNSYLHFADTGTTDSGTAFRAWVKTKPYVLSDFWTKFGLQAAILLAKASAATLTIKMIRNFGIEERSVTTSLAPNGSEVHVVKPIDNASMSELNTIQLEYGDASVSAQEWSLDQFVFKARREDESAG